MIILYIDIIYLFCNILVSNFKLDYSELFVILYEIIKKIEEKKNIIPLFLPPLLIFIISIWFTFVQLCIWIAEACFINQIQT